MDWFEVDRAVMSNGDVLTLRQRGDDFEIRLNLFELMSSRNPTSERELARLACSKIDCPAAKVLIGGLGMGYTARAVLDQIGSKAKLVIAELVPEVVLWNRGIIADVSGRPLEDSRVHVHHGDVRDIIISQPCSFDAIIMDVDNGPNAVLFPENNFLYSQEGVKKILASLRLGGIFALWAAERSLEFEHIISELGFITKTVEVSVQDKSGLTHIIYLVQADKVFS